MRGVSDTGNGVEGIVNNTSSGVYGENVSGFGVAGRVSANGNGYAVYGDSHFSQSSWAGVFDGSVSAEAYFTSSDLRLKKNVKELEYGLHELLQLRPVSFDWNVAQSGDQRQLGLIAQEVQALVPEVVRADTQRDKLGVNYTALVSVLIKSVQQQQAIIESQNERIARLERGNAPIALGSLFSGGLGTAAAGGLVGLGLVVSRARRQR